MAGHNGHDKFLRVNREEEAILFKTRDTQFAAYTTTKSLSNNGGGSFLTSSEYILNPLRFEGGASGTFSFPPSYNDDQLLSDVRKIKPFFEGDVFFQPIFNNTSNIITVDLPSGFVNTTGIPSSTSIEIPDNSYIELVYQYTGTGFDVYQINNSTSSTVGWNHEIISTTHNDTVLSGGVISPDDLLQYNGTHWTNVDPYTATRHEIISLAHVDTVVTNSEQQYDVFVYDGTNWTNSSTIHTGRLQTILTNEILPSTGNQTVFGRNTTDDRFVFYSNADTVPHHFVSIDGPIGSNTGFAQLHITSPTVNPPNNTIGILIDRPSMDGGWANTGNYFIRGEVSDAHWFVRVNGSQNADCRMGSVGTNHHCFSARNLDLMFGNVNQGFNAFISVFNNVTGYTRAPAAGPGIYAYGWFDMINLRNGPLQADTNTPCFIVNSRGETYIRRLRDVGGTANYDNILCYNTITGELVYQSPASFALSAQHTIISSTHPDTGLTAPLQQYDVLLYDGTKWTNSRTTNTGRIQTLLTNTVLPSTGNLVTFGQTGTARSFRFVTTSDAPVTIEAEVTNHISAGEGALRILSNDTTFSNGGAAFYIGIPNNPGNLVNSYFIFCDGVNNLNRFFVRMYGGIGAWVEGDLMTNRQGGCYIFNRSTSGVMGSGTDSCAYFYGESTNVGTRAPPAGPGNRAYGFYDLINVGIGPLSTNTTRQIFAVNSRGEMYVRDLRNVGTSVGYNNPLSYNPVSGEVVYAPAASAKKYKQDIENLDDFIDSSLLYDLPLKKFRYKNLPEEDNLGFIVDDIENNPKCQKLLLRHYDTNELESYRHDFLIPLIIHELQKHEKKINLILQIIQKEEEEE